MGTDRILRNSLDLVSEVVVFANHGRNNRGRVGAVVMRTGIAFLASIVLSANATAAPTQYAVDGLAIGTKLSFDSGSYREYKCSPSEQFEGLSWCQKTRTDKERRGSYTVSYSILHSREGNILYVNRAQEPAFFKRTEAQDDYTAIFAEHWRIATRNEDATSKWYGRWTHRNLGQDYAGATGRGEHQALG